MVLKDSASLKAEQRARISPSCKDEMGRLGVISTEIIWMKSSANHTANSVIFHSVALVRVVRERTAYSAPLPGLEHD